MKRTKAAAPSAIRLSQASVELIEGSRPRSFLNLTALTAMGLGKTIQAIAAIRLLNATAPAQSFLIVAPAGLLRQWRRQFRDWAPELKISTVLGTAAERAAAWAARAQVYITSYEALRSDLPLRAAHGAIWLHESPA